MTIYNKPDATAANYNAALQTEGANVILWHAECGQYLSARWL